MKILKQYPPNFKEIKQFFPWVTGKPGILYAWGDRLYNPSKVDVPQWLQDHEAVHFRQQAALMSAGRTLEEAVRRWWEWYVRDAAFRYQQELPAHRVEYASYMLANGKDPKNKYLNAIAERLSGPLYGLHVTEAEAARLIANVR
jgi:hypothetical protein